MRLLIRGRGLPGRAFSGFHDVRVGLQVRKDPVGLAPADADEVAWETRLDVLDRPGGVDFRGAAVQGRPGERFVYLTWGGVDDGGFTMFRRAKLMLADLPDGLRDEPVVEVEIPLTQQDGTPRCARIPAAVLTWRSGSGSARLGIPPT